MKLKSDSLFNKIKEENLTNENADNVFKSVEHLFKHLEPNSLLFSKIDKIKELQRKNTLSASEEILNILNNSFDYQYPFYFDTDYLKTNIFKSAYKKNDMLRKHIVREANLNMLEPDYNSILGLIEEKKRLEKTPVTYKTIITSIALGVFGLYMAFKFNEFTRINIKGTSGFSALFWLIMVFLALVSYVGFPYLGIFIGSKLFRTEKKVIGLKLYISNELSDLITKRNGLL